jgi:hypothetical protein
VDGGDAAGGAGRRWGRSLSALLAGPLARFAYREDLDPFGQLELWRRGVFPGEMEVVAAAVAGVAVVADPAEGGDGLVLDRLGPFGEARYAVPGAVAFAVAVQRHDIDGEAVVVVGVSDMAVVATDVFAVGQRARVAVGHVDREVGGDPAQVGNDALVDHVAFFVGHRGGDRDDCAACVDDAGRGWAGAGGVDGEQAQSQDPGEHEQPASKLLDGRCHDSPHRPAGAPA